MTDKEEPEEDSNKTDSQGLEVHDIVADDLRDVGHVAD